MKALPIISFGTVRETESKLTLLSKHRFFQKAARLRYSVKNFIQDLAKKPSATVIYFIDTSEFFSFAAPNEETESAFSFYGLLDSSDAGDKQFTLLTTDMIILHRLMFGTQFEGQRAIHSAHAQELDYIFGRFRDDFNEVAKSWYMQIVEKLQEKSITLVQTKRAAEFLLTETSPANLKREFEQFLRDFESVVPKLALQVINDSSKNVDFKRRFDGLEALKSAYLSPQIKFFSGRNSIVEFLGRTITGFSENLFAEKPVLERRVLDITYKIVELLAWRRTSNTETDAAALANVHVLNEFCKEYSFPVEFKLISRTPSLLSLAAALPEGTFNGAVVHPLFIRENYSLPTTNANDVHSQIAELYDRLDGAIAPVLDELYKSYQEKDPSDGGIETHIDEEKSFEEDTELEMEVADAASKIAKLLCGVAMGVASSAVAAEEGIPPEEYLKRVSQEVTAKARGERATAEFHDAVKIFFSNLNFLMAKPNVRAAVQQEVENIETAYVERFVENFPGESDRYFFAVEGSRIHFRMAWGHMRPVFAFSHPTFLRFFELNCTDDRPTFWKLSRISVSKALGYATDKSSDNDVLLRLEAVLLKSLIVAATGHFDMAGQIVSSPLRKIRQLLKTQSLGGDPRLPRIDDALEEIADIRELIAYRELMLLRHFCSRGSAFTGPSFFSAVDRDFPRARRDLDHAFLINKEINRRMGRTSGTDDDRLFLCQASGYFEILVKCWQPEMEGELDTDWQKRKLMHYRAIQQQKNYWALSGIIRRIVSIYESIDLAEDTYSQYLYARSLQTALTGLLVVIIDPNSRLVDALLSPLGQLDHANAQVLREYSEWNQVFRKLTAREDVFFQSSRIILPLADILDAVRDMQLGADKQETKGRIKSSVGSLVDLNEEIERGSADARFRAGSFYHLVLQRLIDVLRQKRLAN